MKHRLFLVIALIATLVLTACGGRKNTEQAVMDMPTPIPTYTPQTENVASQGNAPAIKTETPETEANADQSEETAVVANESETPEEPTAEAAPAEEETPASETPEAEASAPEEPTAEAAPAEEETPKAETATGDPLAGLPEGVAAAMADADPNRGEQLTMQNACTGCHSLDPNATMVGPTWDNLAETAASRVEGQSAAEYLYHSITDPNAYVVEGFPPNVMLQNYADTLSDQDLADIIAYLLDAGQ